MAVVHLRHAPGQQSTGQPAAPAALAVPAGRAEAAGGAQQGAPESGQASGSWDGGSLASQEQPEAEAQAGPGDEWQAAASDYHAASEKFMRARQGRALSSGDGPASGGQSPLGSGSVGDEWSLDE